MIPLTVAEIADLTHGRLASTDAARAAHLVVDGPVVTDSREVAPGGLYVARIGAAHDGHQFLAAARDAGAVAALTTRPCPELPCIVVPDEQAAFAALAHAVLGRVPGLPVVGITGSSGKTSTKDLLAQVLGHAGETVANVGSLNSEVGVPLTVVRLTPTTRFLVVEMGARGVGHIRYLTAIAPPTIGIELNVGSAHIGEFGSRETIAAAKAELVEALPEDGLAILNADDPLVRAMSDRTPARVLHTGESPAADVRATGVRLDDHGRAVFTLAGRAGSATIRLAVAGRHQVGNALAVIAAAHELGMPTAAIADALAVAGPVSRYRMEVTTRADGVTLVNDAYNANPESMAAALDALVAMAGDRRTWAVLGPMFELGAENEAAHHAVGVAVRRHGVDRLMVVGDHAAGIADGAAYGPGELEIERVETIDEAHARLRQELRRGDIVLLKSSNGAGLRFLGDLLLGSEATG